MKKKYIIREFEIKDILSINKYSQGLLNNLDIMLATPARYKSEALSLDGYVSYVGNFGNAIRTVIEKENGYIIAMMTISDIDFNRKTGFFLLYVIDENDKEIILSCVRELVRKAGIYLGLKKIYCSSELVLIANGIWAIDDKDNKIQPITQIIITDEYMKQHERQDILIDIPNYCIDTVCIKEEKLHILNKFDEEMFHPLSENPDYESIASKIVAAADMLIAYNDTLLGIVAFYSNDISKRNAYISSIAVERNSSRKGIGHRLLEKSMEIAKNRGMETISLEVDCKNERAIQFYKKEGFVQCGCKSAKHLFMCRQL